MKITCKYLIFAYTIRYKSLHSRIFHKKHSTKESVQSPEIFLFRQTNRPIKLYIERHINIIPEQ